MTTEEIQQRLIQIREGDDPEWQHKNEDAIYAEFILYVASLEQLPDLAAKAKLVLTTKDMKFERWFA